jgi:two-component system KDP operon response regulator KdpE
LARIRVHLRKTPANEAPTVEIGPLRIDRAAHAAAVNGVELRLTPIEFKLLATLAKHAGKVVTQRQLIAEVWGPRGTDLSQSLRVHMTHLRRKLQGAAPEARLISTETGIGYRLRVE